MQISLLPDNIEIILASGSPRRRELMAGMGLPFRVAKSYAIDEVYPTDLPPHEVPLFLAELKSKAYPTALADNQILITADTVVVHDAHVIGKPKDREEAIDILSTLSGSTHKVTTGVVIRNRSARKALSETAKVTFGNLTLEEIGFYVDHFRPYDKAGSYGIQEWIGYIGIERIEGSFYNVMGLPTRLLYTGLIEFIKTQYTENQ